MSNQGYYDRSLDGVEAIVYILIMLLIFIACTWHYDGDNEENVQSEPVVEVELPVVNKSRKESSMNGLIAQLIPALIAVESGGNAHAVGDNGKALGILQIHEAYWIDGCKFLGVDWDYKTDAFSVPKSVLITQAYLEYYGSIYQATTGWDVTLQKLAQLHNGGPQGTNPDYPDKYRNTLLYWEKVRKHLNLPLDRE